MPAASIIGPLIYITGYTEQQCTVTVLELSVWGASGGPWLWVEAFNRNIYRSPTMKYTMQVFGSGA